MENNQTPENTLDQFVKFANDYAQQPEQATALTWGYEIESNTMNDIYNTAQFTPEFRNCHGLDWQADGSVSDESESANNGEDCECSCDECEHSCDCNNCSIESYELDHCHESDCYGSSEYQEVASIGGLETTHPNTLDLLDQWGLNRATFNEDTGIHIHIGSAHLTAPQVANVLTAYRLASPIINDIAERVGVYYAQAHDEQIENDCRQGAGTSSKYYAVNTCSHFSTHRAQTIEFRQMAGTTRTDLRQTDRVRAYAEILRLLVTYATKPAPKLYWITKATDLTSLIRLLKA